LIDLTTIPTAASQRRCCCLFSRSGNAGAGTVAKDKLGNDIKVDEWLKTHGPNDRTLAQGLKVSDDHGD
jgi:hypothetical protein